MIPESNIRSVGEANANPFKSRSTIIYIFSLFGLLYLNVLCWRAGFLTEVIICISINALVGFMGSVTSHQKTGDETKIKPIV